MRHRSGRSKAKPTVVSIRSWVSRLKPPHKLLKRTRTTRVVLATAHRDHDPTNNDASNLAALCQRCYILHHRKEHLRRHRGPSKQPRMFKEFAGDMVPKLFPELPT